MIDAAKNHDEDSFLDRLCRDSSPDSPTSPADTAEGRRSVFDDLPLELDTATEHCVFEDTSMRERLEQRARESAEAGSRFLRDAPDATGIEIPPHADSAEKITIVRDAWIESKRYERDVVDAAFEGAAKLTERVLANLVIKILGDDLRWNPSERRWLHWTGKVWARTNDETITGKVLDVAEWLAAGAFFEHLRWRYIDALTYWADSEDLGDVRIVEKVADPGLKDWAPTLPEKVATPSESNPLADKEIHEIAVPTIANIDLLRLVSELLGGWCMPRNPQAARIKGEKLSSRRVIRDVIDLVKTQVLISSDELDRHPDLLCVQNGVVDLRSGALRPHTREFLLTQMISLDYDPEAKCPTWLKCLADWQSDDLHPFIQRVVGHFLSGWTQFEYFYIVQGPAKSGKSTFLNTIRRVMGDYAAAANPRLVSKLDEGAVRDDLARLQGKRLAHIQEWSPRGDVDACVIKRIVTSENEITAAFKHRDEFEFHAEFTIAIDTNSRPPIKDQSEGVWRRMIVIPFSNVIEDVRPGVIEEALREERHGILAWAIDGAVQLHRQGLGIPEQIMARVEEYRSLTDPFQSFLEWAIVPKEGGTIHADLLYNAYKNFCGEAETAPFSKPAFYSTLNERGFERKRRKIYHEKPWCIIGMAWSSNVPGEAKNRRKVEPREEPREYRFSLDT